MEREQMRQRLAEIQGTRSANFDDFPVTTWGKLDDILFDHLHERIAQINEYLHNFMPPQEQCPMCGGQGVDWGLAHGQAFCIHCRYPIKIYHYDVAGTAVHMVGYGMWYHPRDISIEKEEAG